MDNLPFDLESRVHLGTGQELKDRNFSVDPFPINHVETNRWGSWENRFEYELARIGIKQDKTTTDQSEATVPATHLSPKKKNILNERDLIKFVQANNLRIEDNRSKGGALWVLTDTSNAKVNSELERFGFFYKPYRGWWYN